MILSGCRAPRAMQERVASNVCLWCSRSCYFCSFSSVSVVLLHNSNDFLRSWPSRSSSPPRSRPSSVAARATSPTGLAWSFRFRCRRGALLVVVVPAGGCRRPRLLFLAGCGRHIPGADSAATSSTAASTDPGLRPSFDIVQQVCSLNVQSPSLCNWCVYVCIHVYTKVIN